MPGGYLVVDDLQTLINAVDKYQEELATNQVILQNAANVCDFAMGSDDIVKKHIAQLNDALVELSKTANIAASVSEALKEDLQRAIDVI